MRLIGTKWIAALAAMSLLTSSFAQEPAQAAPSQPEQAAREEPKKDPKTDAYEKAVKDLTKFEGAFTLYQRKNELLLELPEDKIGKLFFVQGTFQTGVAALGATAGFSTSISDGIDVFKFERRDEQVWLVKPVTKKLWDNDDPFRVSIERAFPEAILASYRIEQQDPDNKKLLINISSLFTGDVLRLGELMGAILGGPYNLDREKSFPVRVKAGADATIVTMRLHFFSPRGAAAGNPLAALLGLGGAEQLEDDRSAPIQMTFTLWYRQDSDYMPRLADPRIGYFTTDRFDFGRFTQLDRTTRFINRFNLKKKDPSAELSEPVKPIVFHIDPSVPRKYRDAVVEGVLYWNRAFEAIGYKDAIRTIVVDENDKDWDHADARYNVVRWSMSESPQFAGIALLRADPFTGELLQASLNIDASAVQAAVLEHQRIVTPASGWMQRALSVLTTETAEHQHSEDGTCCSQKDFDWILHGSRTTAQHALQQRLRAIGWSTRSCGFQIGKAENASMAWLALNASFPGRISREDYVRAYIRETVAHEVGHLLGLRHNFIASTRLTTEQLGDEAIIAQFSTTASVMDYNPVNIVAALRGQGTFYAPKIGEYDMLAIRYGYQDIPNARTPIGERHVLSQIAAQTSREGQRFMTDENADSFDPFVVRFDNARDPLAYSEKILEANRRIREHAIRNLPRPGESYVLRTQLIISSINRVFREGRSAARFVGGMSSNRAHAGDPGRAPGLAPVDPRLQRQALQMIVRHCLTADAFDLPEEVLMNLVQDPNDEDASSRWTAPLRQIISSQQAAIVSQLLAATTIARISENQFKWGNTAGRYTMDEHYGTILGAVFSEVGTNRSMNPLRRDLQRFVVNALITQAGAAPGGINEDARMVATDALRRLSIRFGEAIRNAIQADVVTQTHLRDSKESIDRFFARQQVISR